MLASSVAYQANVARPAGSMHFRHGLKCGCTEIKGSELLIPCGDFSTPTLHYSIAPQ